MSSVGCSRCSCTGRIPPSGTICPECKGRGRTAFVEISLCLTCRGSGTHFGQPCESCGGSGKREQLLPTR